MTTQHTPERLALFNGEVCSALRNGDIPLNSLVFEGQNVVTAYNAVAEQRDELAAALRMALRAIPEGKTYPAGLDPTDPDAEIDLHYELSALLAKLK